MNAVASSNSGLPVPPKTIEAEQALLGAVLVNNEAYHLVSGFLQPRHFSEPIHALIYEVMGRAIGLGRKATPKTLVNSIPDLRIGEITAREYVARLASEATTIVNTPDYGRTIFEAALERDLMIRGQRIIDSAGRGFSGPTVEEQLAAAEDSLAEVRAELRSTEDNGTTLAEAAARLIENAAAVKQGKVDIPTTGFSDVDKQLGGGFRPGRLVVIGARPGMGKAQPLDSKVLTAEGWKRMGDIRVGERVAVPRGGFANVIGVYPQGRKPVFKVTFHDGRSARSCAEHIWRVWHRRWGEWRDLELQQIMGYADPDRFAVPLGISSGPEKDDLPLDPYLLGVLLGDGNFRPAGVRFSTADSEIVRSVESACGASLRVRHLERYDYAILGIDGRSNSLVDAIRTLGLDGTRSHDKFVPPAYLEASFEARRALLQGLLDTDGTVERDKTIRFSSVSERLAQDVVYLARSLGAWAKIKERKRPSYPNGDGVKVLGRRCWIVTIRHHAPAMLFGLQRKINRLGNGGQYRDALRLSIAKIEPAGTAKCQCIMLDDQASLYFTDDFTVTHNTALGCSSARRVAKAGYGVSFFSLEIDDVEISSRIVADEIAGTDYPLEYRDILAGNLDDRGVLFMKHGVKSVSELPIAIEYAPGISMAEIEARVRMQKEIFARKGIRLGVVYIDYLGLIRASERYRGQRVNELGEIVLQAKNMAKRLEVCVVLFAQLSREVEKRDDKRPILSDLRDSGNIEEHADAVCFLYRPAYYLEKTEAYKQGDADALQKHSDLKFDLEFITDKNRLGPTGRRNLYCDVARSRIDNKSHYG